MPANFSQIHNEIISSSANHRPRLVSEALARHPDLITGVISHPGQKLPPFPQGLQHIIFRSALFAKLNFFGTPGPLLWMRLPDLPQFDWTSPWPAGATLFIPFGNPDNVGAVIRSAAALGAARIILTAEAASPFLPRALRASAGTVWRTPLEQAGPLADLDMPDREIYALDASGVPLDSIKPAGAYGLIAGEEGPGLPEPLARKTRLVSIPMRQDVESLNAAVAVAVTLWAWRAAGRA
ncbi:MAG: RNA methyltransferase [Lentisphaerae bacterium]|nr:RNA methyltransferase [Lentisphaerota bacterium]